MGGKVEMAMNMNDAAVFGRIKGLYAALEDHQRFPRPEDLDSLKGPQEVDAFLKGFNKGWVQRSSSTPQEKEKKDGRKT
jgi:hypothetical protein